MSPKQRNRTRNQERGKMIVRHVLVSSLLIAFLSSLIASGSESLADDRLRVACTLPVLKSIAEEVGGDRVESFALAKGEQDPHFVSPTPILMSKVRKADLLLEIGMQLELWADQVADGSGNSKLFRGGVGRVPTAIGIPKLEVPSVISRSQGDIHPEGNPHVWLDPIRAKKVASNIAQAFSAARPSSADYFRSRAADFARRVDEAYYGAELVTLVGSAELDRHVVDGDLFTFLEGTKLHGRTLDMAAGGWLTRGRPLRGLKAVQYHKVWAYFAQSFGIDLAGVIEPFPGIPPGPQQIRRIVDLVRDQKVSLILVDNFYDPSTAQGIAAKTTAHVVVLPSQVEGEPGVRMYFDLIDHVLTKLLSAVPAPAPSPLAGEEPALSPSKGKDGGGVRG